MLADFVKRMEIVVVNTYKKREEQRVTCKSGGRCTHVDNILCNMKDTGDCKVALVEKVDR